jgi:hypothetical protein
VTEPAWKQAPLADQRSTAPDFKPGSKLVLPEISGGQQPAWKAAPLAGASAAQQPGMLSRIGGAAVEGFQEGYGGPVQGASPWVRQNLIGNLPVVSQVDQFLLDTIPQAVRPSARPPPAR